MDVRETQEILRRAQEIESQQGVMLKSQADVEQFISAAEEAGLSRDAVLQALRERLRMPAEAFVPGSLVFAESADGRFHVASLTSLDEHTARIRYLNGGDAVCSVSQLRMFSLAPGLRIECLSPSMNMWLSTSVLRFNPDARSVTVNNWGTEETVTLEHIRLPREGVGRALEAKLWSYALAAGVIGAGVGMLVMRIILR